MSILERTRSTTHPEVALPIGPRTAAVLVLASVVGLMMLCWPLILVAQPGTVSSRRSSFSLCSRS